MKSELPVDHSMRIGVLHWAIVLALVILCSCGNGDSSGGGNSDGDGADGKGDGEFLLPVGYPCELSTVFEKFPSPARCYDVEVPLDWQKPDGEMISLFVKQVFAKKTPRAQLWFLQGGPGASSHGIEMQMGAVQHSHADIEALTLDHRGVARSFPLACDGAAPSGTLVASNATACVAEIEQSIGAGNLAHFSATQAATDLDYAMGLFGSDDTQRYVWAASYGTYWAMRQMQVAQTQLDGAILEALLPGPQTDFPADEPTEQKLLEMLDACRADAYCGGKLVDPVATLTFLKRHFGVDHCTELSDVGMTWLHMQEILLGLSYNRFSQILVAPLLYRMERCQEHDRTALLYLNDVMTGTAARSGNGGEFSVPLHINIVTSELFKRSDATIGQLREQGEQMLIGPPVRAHYAALYDVWPRYQDALTQSWPEPDYPVLLLNGVLDPITPAAGAQLVAENIASATMVQIPWATHDVLLNSPATIGSGHCAYDIASAFLEDPTASLPLACLDAVLPYNWRFQEFKGREVVSVVSRQLMGVYNPWEPEP